MGMMWNEEGFLGAFFGVSVGVSFGCQAVQTSRGVAMMGGWQPPGATPLELVSCVLSAFWVR
jgi:hypothetical protein